MRGEDPGGAPGEWAVGEQASPARSRLRVAAALLAVAICISAVFVWRRSFEDALRMAWGVGWWALWTLLLFWLWNHAAALGWRALIPAGRRPPSLWLALVRMQAQAVNLVLPTGSIGGDLLRSALVGPRSGNVATGASSVVLDTAVSAIAGMLFSMAGLAAHPSGLPGVAAAMVTMLVLTASTVGAVYFSPSIAALARRRGWTARSPRLGMALQDLAESPRRLRSSAGKAMAWHLLERLLMAAEIWVIARGMGITMSLSQVLFTAAVMTAFSILLFFIPGQVGAIEGGLSLAFVAVGLAPTAGLSVALVRRARQLVVMCAGFLLLAITQAHASIRTTNGFARTANGPAEVHPGRRHN